MKNHLFIAIDFPKETKEEITGLINQLKAKYPKIRWEKKENLHLTLKFLGWVDTKIKYQNDRSKFKNSKIIKGIEKASTGIKSFWFQPKRLSCFLRQSLIVWLGARSQEELFQIVKNLKRKMLKLDFPKERREFLPHITIGRAKKPS